MKNTFFLLALCLLFTGYATANAQTNAGAVPGGMSITNPNVNLSVSTSMNATGMAFDVDCDGNPDLMATLWKGTTAIDIPNEARLERLNPNIEICGDTGVLSIAKQYVNGDPLLCMGSEDWRPDTMHLVANYGCFLCPGPWDATDTYIAYRIGTQIGWIKMSYNINDLGSGTQAITFDINEVLSPCTPNSLSDPNPAPALTVYPNPSDNGTLRIESSESIAQVEVLNLMGQRLQLTPLSHNELTLPQESGLYVLRISGKKGSVWTRKVLRN